MAPPAAVASTSDNLRDYLSNIAPATRAMLLHELEYGSLAGTLTIGLDRVIDELRAQQRGSGQSIGRVEGPARRFFYPLEPFLIDEHLPEKLRGRIQRSSLLPVWNLLTRFALPQEAETFAKDLGSALAYNDEAKADLVTDSFRAAAIRVIDEMLDTVEKDSAARSRIAGHLEGERTLDDLPDIVAVLRAERKLASLAAYLPARIEDFTDADLKNLNSLFLQPALSHAEMMPFALALVLSRLARPAQLLLFVPRVNEGKPGRPAEASDFCYAIDLVLGEISRAVYRVESDLRARRNLSATAGIKKVQELLADLGRAIELPLHTYWGQQLNLMRTDFAVLIRNKVEGLPGRILRVLRPRTSREIESGTRVDSEEVADIEGLLRLLSACRAFANHFALKEIISRLDEELEGCLDTATPYLLISMSKCDPQHRSFLLSQIDAAVRFDAQRCGKPYAELLAKVAASVAQDGVAVH